MRELRQQYVEQMHEILEALDPDTLAKLHIIGGQIMGLVYEYDLNSVPEYDAAIYNGVPLPYEHPDEWLSLSDFFVMAFETGALAGDGS